MITRKLVSADAADRLALSAAELARKLGISERHLWAMHKSGRLGPEPLRWGRVTRWVSAEVSDWLAHGAPERAAWQQIKAARGLG